MSNTKNTLVLGASPNPSRYSYLAIERLKEHGHEVIAVGKRDGIVSGVTIEKELGVRDNIDTVTMYLGAPRQEEYLQEILALNPKRIIFNPGAENSELVLQAEAKGIETLEACTLTMLAVGNY